MRPICSKLDSHSRAERDILRAPMRIHFHLALVGVQLLMWVGAWQVAGAQPSYAAAIEPRSALTTEQVVDNLVRRNVERAQALEGYQGTRIYRLEYHGFPASRSAEMVVDARYIA